MKPQIIFRRSFNVDFLLGYSLLALAWPSAKAASPVTEKVKPAIADRQASQWPDRVHLRGWMGLRVAANETNRLLRLDPDRLLEGYRKRPGRQAWDGEHVGKWLHAASLAWANSGNPKLREKLDLAVAELLKCQLEDGYLGTYLEQDRWTEWDVWAHKYNLIGLLTYMHYTGNLEPLPACRQMADLLCKTFGDGPGQRDLIKAGHHVGLAPTSVLEPMVLLYRVTGEPRYLEFCKYIFRAWEQPNGPKVISTLLTQKRVDKVGNGKAYEMLSCLNGALEYYRTVGGAEILQACLNAWQDIVDKRLYITGAASYGELFHDDYDLPNVGNVGETCVTVTWLQFNGQLLRLTGEARFAEQLERVVLNQLFGAQRCDGSGWGYYVQMEGKKPYSSTLDGHCCLSSGPRGVAFIPTMAITTSDDSVVVNLYDSGSATLQLRDQQITVTTDTFYPARNLVRLTLDPGAERSFTVKLRIPSWCKQPGIKVKGQDTSINRQPDGYAAITQVWRKGDVVELSLDLKPQTIAGEHKNQGKVAVAYGPLILAADQALLSENDGIGLAAVAAAGPDLGALGLEPEPAPPSLQTWPGAKVFRVNAVTRRAVGGKQRGTPLQIRLVPFAEAGGTGSDYKVWLPLPRSGNSGNVLADGKESRSRAGNVDGSISDEEPGTAVVTFDAKPAAEDWFSVALDEPSKISRIVFAHGRTFHDGGWFDAGSGKPRVEIKTAKDGPWIRAGELANYPATTGTSAAALKGGEKFECRLGEPVRVWAVRVIGKPACGDNPQQAFASCAELQAFAE